MGKKYVIGISLLLLCGFVWFLFFVDTTPPQKAVNDIGVKPVSHASFVLEIGGLVIYNDPVGESSLYDSFAAPDIILVSDIHRDHFNVDTISTSLASSTIVIAPQVVVDEFPETILDQVVVMSNGDIHEVAGLVIEAMPMYNLPPSDDAYHVKGRGNGYLLTVDENRVYIAGDTADIPEMRALTNVNVAFIPMNLPYTMDVDVAADAVLDFAPAVVYPYHYRNAEGFADITEFSRLVATGNPSIEVRRLDWYPDAAVVVD